LEAKCIAGQGDLIIFKATICLFHKLLLKKHVDNSCVAKYLYRSRDALFSGSFDEQKVQKQQQIFCNVKNVFTVTFDQFNASLLNKSISFFLKENLTDQIPSFDQIPIT